VNIQTLEKIRDELAARLVGQKFGKIFPVARLQLAIDFRLHDSNYLFIGVEPNAPRIYLIKRRVRDLEKLAAHSSPFVLFLRKRLANAVLQSVEQMPDERVLRFEFEARTELGETENYSLIVQLTGRSANLFLLDKNDFVLDGLRETRGGGQEIGGKYAPPIWEGEKRKRGEGENFSVGNFESLSESLDEFYLEKDAEQRFQARAKAAAAKLKQEIGKREKLVKKLEQDLANHGDAEKWKRSGDLILANLSDAVRLDGKILVIDYFDENVPTVEIEADENDSLTEAAEKLFRRYTKARNAKAEISKRLDILTSELDELNLKKARLDEAIAEKDESVIDEFTTVKIEKPSGKQKEKHADNFTGARRFTSSDGFEILVGKASKDNDFLTFRLAKAGDLWLHAADYPGSHVVIRNPSRQEIPPKTLLEAAQIAAFYSHAREQPKVAVHYTPKKFVNKPKGAVAGLVSLSSFKTILVEPKIEAKNEAEK
jgi:predicted ribosome quality control (RQC) complex YloA/Tae2 family protein